jgi:acyl-CoA synthetase (NDP forming)
MKINSPDITHKSDVDGVRPILCMRNRSAPCSRKSSIARRKSFRRHT